MTSTREITYLSAPTEVNMGDHWYEIASLDHFWIRRRFHVLQMLGGQLLSEPGKIAEVGCGSGLVQRQIEKTYGREVAGFDLNDAALRKNISQLSPTYCYNILERHPNLKRRFDVVLLLDVLEHIRDEQGFLKALSFHLSLGGHLVLNVPAGQWAYSRYDRAVGHIRRYRIGSLLEAIRPCGFTIKAWTYWGLPLLPVLILRNFRVRSMNTGDEIIHAGLDPQSATVDRILSLLASCEPIPQKLIGTSLMAVLQAGS